MARDALDVQARQLRNLAKRLNNTPMLDPVGRLRPRLPDLRSRRTWVRYCLDTLRPPARRARGACGSRASAASTPASPVTPAMRPLPAGRRLDEHARRRRATSSTASTASTAPFHVPLLERGPDLYLTVPRGLRPGDHSARVDATSTPTPPPEPPDLRLATAVYLRNQNQPPVARFVATPPRPSRPSCSTRSGSIGPRGPHPELLLVPRHTAGARGAATAPIPPISGSGPLRTLWGAHGFVGESVTLSYQFSARAGRRPSGRRPRRVRSRRPLRHVRHHVLGRRARSRAEEDR